MGLETLLRGDPNKGETMTHTKPQSDDATPVVVRILGPLRSSYFEHLIGKTARVNIEESYRMDGNLRLHVTVDETTGKSESIYIEGDQCEIISGTLPTFEKKGVRIGGAGRNQDLRVAKAARRQANRTFRRGGTVRY